MGFLKQGFSGALAAVMVLTSGGLCVGQSVTIHAETKAKTYEDYKKVLNYTAEYQGYEAYKEGLENVKRPETSYEINGADYVTCEGMEPEVLTDYEGMEGTSVYTEESGMLTYEVDIAEEGMYEFGISYYPVAGNGSSIQRSFFVDGELSYRELSLIEFSRVWVNTSDIWDEDNQGNDLKPTQMEAPEWLFSRFYDQDGYVTEPLSIFLTKGKHEITVVSRREPMIFIPFIYRMRNRFLITRPCTNSRKRTGYQIPADSPLRSRQNMRRKSRRECFIRYRISPHRRSRRTVRKS